MFKIKNGWLKYDHRLILRWLSQQKRGQVGLFFLSLAFNVEIDFFSFKILV